MSLAFFQKAYTNLFSHKLQKNTHQHCVAFRKIVVELVGLKNGFHCSSVSFFFFGRENFYQVRFYLQKTSLMLTLLTIYPLLSSIRSGALSIFSCGLKQIFIFNCDKVCITEGLPQWLSSKESAYNVGAAGDMDLIAGLGRSPGGGHGNPLQYSCQENPHGQRSLVGYSPQGRNESDTTEVTQHGMVHVTES